MKVPTLIVVLACVLVACGGGESTSPTSQPAGATEQAASSSTTVQEPSSSTTEVVMDAELVVTTTAYDEGAPIPVRYTCDGDDVSPPFEIASIPAGAQSLALVMDDPDAPGGVWDHWVAFDIEPTTVVPEDVGAIGTSGSNSWGRLGYGGPCPPSGTHRYITTVYALDLELGLDEGATKADVLAAMAGHVLAEGAVMGTYSRDQ